MRVFVLIVGLAAVSAGGVAHATTTFVDPRGNLGNERCLYGNGLTCPTGGAYGGDVSIIRAMEIDQDLAAGTIVRVDDDLDKLWESTVTNGGQVIARARYAAHTLSLGYDSGGGYNFLMQNTGDFVVRVDNAADFAGTPHASDFRTWTSTWVNIPLTAGADFAFVLSDHSHNANRHRVGLGKIGRDKGNAAVSKGH